MRKVKDRLYPDLYFKFDREGSELLHWQQLKDYEKAQAWTHGKFYDDVKNRPGYQWIMDHCSHTVMNIGGGYLAESWNAMRKMVEANGYKVQWILKDAMAQKGAWGMAFLDSHDRVQEYIESLGIWEEYSKLPAAKQVSRLSKILGQYEEFNRKPKVKIVPKGTYPPGIMPANVEWMSENELRFGCKTTRATKGLIVPAWFNTKGYDLFVTEDENKINLSEEKLSIHIKVIRNMASSDRFSRNMDRRYSGNTGRNPTYSLDLHGFLNTTPHPKHIEHLKPFYYGAVTKEQIADKLFSYTHNGEKKYRKEGELVLQGRLEEVIPEYNRVLSQLIIDSLQPEVEGIYGQAMPMSILRCYKEQGEKIYGYGTRLPWNVPVLHEYRIWQDSIFVDDELHATFGGDYDGDLFTIYDREEIRNGFVWKCEKDILKAAMKMPAKVDSAGIMSNNDSIAIQLDQQMLCGVAYHNCKRIVDAARLEGRTEKELQILDMKMYAREVQPFLDGMKYTGTLKRKNLKYLCKQYGVNLDMAKRVTESYDMFRGNSASVHAAVDHAKKIDLRSVSIYEKMTSMFKDW